MKSIILTIAVTFLGSAAFTQDTISADTTQGHRAAKTHSDTTIRRLSEILISATRTEKNPNESGRSATVIGQADIARSGANSLAELLSAVEGIYIPGTNQNPGANQSIFIRGTNSNHSLILIDGIPLTDPSSPTAALDISEISLSQVDRIEVVRGAHSTLYGSGAIGGAINIVTKKNSRKGFHVNAKGTGGSFGEGTSFIDQNIDLNYTFENGVYANWGFHTTDANGPDATIDTASSNLFPRDLDGMSRLDFGGRVGVKNSKWDVNVYGRSAEKTSDIDNREFDDDDNYQLMTDREILGYQIAHKVDTGITLAVRGAHSFLSRTAINDSSLVDLAGNYNSTFYRGDYSGETFLNELQADFKKENYSLVLGGLLDRNSMSQDIYSYYLGSEFQSSLDSLDLLSETYSFFFLTELQGALFSEKTKSFSLTAGGRYNSNNTFGSSFTYQLNPMIQLNKHTQLYANLASGYNAPSLYQLHSPDRDPSSKISRGNINLRPETSLTREFGINQRIDKYTGITLGFYKTVVNDVIEYVYLWDGTVNIPSLSFADYRGDTYLNLGTLTTEGVELSARGRLGRKMFVSGSFSYLRGRQDFYQSDIDTVKIESNHVQLYNSGEFLGYTVRSFGLTRRPVTASLSITWKPSKRVYVRPDIRYVSKRKDVIYDYTLGPFGALGSVSLGSYTLVDVVSGIKLSRQVNTSVRIENLFDVQYSEIRGFTSRGRSFFISLDYSF